MKPDELLQNAKADHAYVTKNEHKIDRERWVLDRWLAAQGEHPKEIRQGDDPPDFVVDGIGVEIVEAMEASRRRGDDYKAKVVAAEQGDILVRQLPSLSEVREDGHMWILHQVKQKTAKPYDANASSQWKLLVYANFSWADKVQWRLLEAKLLELHPPFARVEVVYSVAETHVARTIFVASKD